MRCDRTRVTPSACTSVGTGPDPNDTQLAGHYHSDDAAAAPRHGLAHLRNETRGDMAGITADRH